MRISDWSSDVCSSDLAGRPEGGSDRPRDRRDRPSTATASVRAAGRTLDNESRPSLGFIGVIYDPHLAIRFLSRNLAPIIDNPMTNGGGYMRLRRSDEHTTELQSLMRISYAVFCMKKKNTLITK